MCGGGGCVCIFVILFGGDRFGDKVFIYIRYSKVRINITKSSLRFQLLLL